MDTKIAYVAVKEKSICGEEKVYLVLLCFYNYIGEVVYFNYSYLSFHMMLSFTANNNISNNNNKIFLYARRRREIKCASEKVS